MNMFAQNFLIAPTPSPSPSPTPSPTPAPTAPAPSPTPTPATPNPTPTPVTPSPATPATPVPATPTPTPATPTPSPSPSPSPTPTPTPVAPTCAGEDLYGPHANKNDACADLSSTRYNSPTTPATTPAIAEGKPIYNNPTCTSTATSGWYKDPQFGVGFWGGNTWNFTQLC